MPLTDPSRRPRKGRRGAEARRAARRPRPLSLLAAAPLVVLFAAVASLPPPWRVACASRPAPNAFAGAAPTCRPAPAPSARASSGPAFAGKPRVRRSDNTSSGVPTRRRAFGRRTALQVAADRHAAGVAAALGKSLKSAPLRQRLTQREAGARAGLAPTTFSEMERGQGGDVSLLVWSRAASAVGSHFPRISKGRARPTSRGTRSICVIRSSSSGRR